MGNMGRHQNLSLIWPCDGTPHAIFFAFHFNECVTLPVQPLFVPLGIFEWKEEKKGSKLKVTCAVGHGRCILALYVLPDVLLQLPQLAFGDNGITFRLDQSVCFSV